MRTILTLVLIAAVIAGGAWLDYRRFLEEPIAIAEGETTLEIPRGSSLRALSEELTARGLLSHPYYFLTLAKLSGQAGSIQAGEYRIADGITPPQLLARLTSGKVVQHAITLVEGWTFRQAAAALIADARLGDRLDGLEDAEIMALVGAPERHPEGRFFPDTYHFTKGTEDLEILRRAYRTMERVLAEEWEQRAPDLPIETPDEALILASIVEKETGLASERARIAGVFVRRLQRGMKLQTDPTVIYGLGDAFDGNLRRADLKRDTPYNTYVHPGLPPTPIALPGREAIHAVLHPADGDSLYFVARGDGGHYFSATLAEHNRAVRRFQLKRN